MFGIDDALIVAGGASLVSGFLGADAARDAAGAQADATKGAVGEQRRQFDVTRTDQAPYRELGSSAINTLRRMAGFPTGGAAGIDQSDPRYKAIYDRTYNYIDQLHRGQFGMPLAASTDGSGASAQLAEIERSAREQFLREYPNAAAEAQASPDFNALNKRFTIDDFWQDPVTQLSYQSGRELGEKALYNAAPLTTGRDSGAALKELTKFGQDYAGSKAGESQQRFEGQKSNVFNRLMAMIGGGQVANQVTAAAGANMANNVSSLVSAQGNANAASRVGQANSWSGALGNIANWWNQQNVLNRVFPPRTPTTTPGPVGDFYSWGGGYA